MYSYDFRFSTFPLTHATRVGEIPLMMSDTASCVSGECDMCSAYWTVRHIQFYKSPHDDMPCISIGACYKCIECINDYLLTDDDTLLYGITAGERACVIDIETLESYELSLPMPPNCIVKNPVESSPTGGVFYNILETHKNTPYLVRLDVPEENYDIIDVSATFGRHIFMRDNVLYGALSLYAPRPIVFCDLRAPRRIAFEMDTVECFGLRSAAFVSENMLAAISLSSEYMYDIRSCARVYAADVDGADWQIV